MKKLSIAFALVSFGLVACGGGGAEQGRTNPMSARSAVDSAAMVKTTLTGSDGTGAGNAVGALNSASSAIVMPMSAGHPALPDFTPLFQDDGRALRANTTECMCTATGCTFNNCGGSSAGGTWTINGTIMVSGDTYTFDLDYHIVTGGVDYAWTIDGSLTLTATSIDGSMTSKGHGTVNTMGYNFSYDYDVSTDFNMVVLDGQSCPTGGSIHSEVSYSTSGVQGGEAGNYHVQGTVTFGPTCGAAM